MVLESRLRNFNSRRQSRSVLILASAQQHHVFLSAIRHMYGKIISILMIQTGNVTLLQCFFKGLLCMDVEEVTVYTQCHQTCCFACTNLVRCFITNFHMVLFPVEPILEKR